MKKFIVALGIEFLLLCLLYHFLFTTFLPEKTSWQHVGIVSLIMLLPVGMIHGMFQNFREIALLRRSNNPNLKDGERVALSGYIRPLNETLLSPFTKKQCVSYYYDVTKTVRTKIGKDRSTAESSEYSGNVQVPSILQTNITSVRLLGLMQGDVETLGKSDQAGPTIFQNAYEYLSSRQFEQSKQSVSKAWKSTKELITDNDGSMLWEIKITDQQLDLTDRTLKEWCLEINKPYSIIGVWSAAQNGLISDPFGKGNINVLKGDATEAIATMRGKLGCLIILAIFLFVFINGFAYLFLNK